MKTVIAWDSETCLFRPGVMAPELACAQHQGATNDSGLWVPFYDAELVHWTECEPLFRRWLSSADTLVGHNVAYDFSVMGAQFPHLVPAIFEAYDQDRVTDTMLRQKLLDIAGGCYRGQRGADGAWKKVNYHLLDLVRKHTGRMLVKDTWRMFYGEFRDVPLAQWPAHALIVKEKFRPDLERLLAQQAAHPKDFAMKEELAHLQGMIGSDPEDVIRYALDDARSTLDCFIPQEKHSEFLADQYRQARKDFWLHLASTWGLRTNTPGVERLKLETEREREEVRGRLVSAGLVRPDGSRDTKAATAHMLAVCKAKGIPPRLTEGGAKDTQQLDTDARFALLSSQLKGVSLDEDSCEATGDELLEDYALFSTLGTLLSKDVPALAAGTVFPVHTHFGLAASGRVTSAGPNIQNWKRSTDEVYCRECGVRYDKPCKDHPGFNEAVQGIRECFYPRQGFVFIDSDYDQLELRTLAQVCVTLFGESELAKALNAGIDPHTALASEILGISYEEGARRRKSKDKQFDATRQAAKVANFGYPGGLGAKTFVKFARKSYGVTLDADPDVAIDKAKSLKKAWLARWPEMEEFFKYVDSLGDPATLEQIGVQRVRGGCTYTAACNSLFQGLGSDATGRAGWHIARAQYVDQASPLFGSRTVNYVHDEWIVETPDTHLAHDAAYELSRLMKLGADELLPDVPSKTEPLLMRWWSKAAEPVFVNGRLIPWPAVA